MGVDIDDKEMAMAVLNGLPERFNSLISTLDALGTFSRVYALDSIHALKLFGRVLSHLRAIKWFKYLGAIWA